MNDKSPLVAVDDLSDNFGHNEVLKLLEDQNIH